MFSKLFLLALVSVSLVQVRGDNELELAIQKGIHRVRDIKNGAYYDYEKYKDLSVRHVNGISKRVTQLKETGAKDVKEAEGTLTSMAEYYKEKAKESSKSESVLLCINRYAKEAEKQINKSYSELETDIVKLSEPSVDDIVTFDNFMSRHAVNLESSLKEAICKIERCADAKAVDYAVGIFESWVNNLRSEFRWITREVTSISQDHANESSSYYSSYKAKLSKILSSARRSMRLCIFNRSAFDGLLKGW